MRGTLGLLTVVVGVAVAAAAGPALVGGGPTALPESSGWGPNLVQNGDFETLGPDGRPLHWHAPSRQWSLDRGPGGAGRSFKLADPSATPEYDHATQTLRLPRGVYRLSGWIRTEALGDNARGSGVRLRLGGRTTPVVSGTRPWTRYELAPVVVGGDGEVAVQLEVYAAWRDGRSVQPSGTAWFADIRVEPQTPPAVEAFMLYPNFRGMLFPEGPPVMRFEVRVRAAGAPVVRADVVDEADGALVASRDFPAAERFVAEVDGSGLPVGRAFLVSFGLLDAGGRVLARTPPYRVSRVAPGVRARMRIAFDEKNRVLVHGVPRFVLGVYDSSGAYAPSERFWDEALWSARGRRLEGVRINFYLNYKMGEAALPAMDALMDSLRRRGVMYLQTGNCHEDRPADARPFAIHSDRYVRQLGSHPASAGYYTVDECRPAVLPSVFAQYVRLRRLHPDSLTFAVQTAPAELPLWRDAADVLATDPYPLFRWPPAGGYRHGLVAEWTRLSREAVREARPVMTVLQFFTFQGSPWPTLAEMRQHAYMAVVEGARGLWWWSIGDGEGALDGVCPGWCAEKVELMGRLRAVVNDLADLEPVLLADDAPAVAVRPAAIRTRARRHGGHLYLFTYNAGASPVTAAFELPAVPRAVHVHAEGRRVPVEGRSFTDDFAPWQAHVYVIDTP